MENINKDKILQLIQTHTYHPKIDDFYGDLFDAYKLEEIRPLQKLISQVHKLEISLADFLRAGSALQIKNWEEKLWPQILRYDFLPIADALGIDFNEWANKLSAELQKSLVGKIITTEKWVSGYVLSQNLKVSSEGQRRLVFLANEYLRGERSVEEIKEQLLRPFKVGGLEFEIDMAEKFVNDLVARFDESTINAEILTSQKVGEIVLKEENKSKPVVVVPAPVPVAAAPKMPAVTPPAPVYKPPLATAVPKMDVNKNIKADIAEMQKTAGVNIILPPIDNYERQAEEVIKQSGVMVAPDLTQRLKTIISSRLREVRKQSETKERLISHTLNGGMGLSAEAAEKIMVLVEEAKKKNNVQSSAEIKKPKQAVVAEKSLEPPLPKIQEFQEPASLRHPKPDEGSLELPKKVTDSSSTSASWRMADQNDISKQPVVSKVVPPVAKLAPKPVAISSDIRSSAPVLKITEEKNKPKVQEISMPVAFKPPVTSAIPQTPSGRARVEDVAFAPRLMGPIEELREMSLLEFRRLSPKPRVASDKIVVKVDLLAKEGYEKKLKGIEAWQKSPLNKLYNALLSESLSRAKAVVEIIKEKLAGRQETLSEEEFKVIMELNRVLRF